MKLADIMQSELVEIQPDASLREALQQMVQARIRHLVVRGGDRFYGIVTDRDLRFALPSRLLASSAASWDDLLEHASVEAVCIRNPFVLGPEVDVASAAAEMCRRRIGCIPVVANANDGDGTLVGIVTTTDMLYALSQIAPVATVRPIPTRWLRLKRRPCGQRGTRFVGERYLRIVPAND